MNPNVDALTGILLLVFEGATWYNGEEFNADDAAHYAGKLAAEGVLAPKALRVAITFGEPGVSNWTDCPLCGDDIGRDFLDRGIARLEQIAKGDSAAPLVLPPPDGSGHRFDATTDFRYTEPTDG